jgi:hypothetical protein
MDALAKSSASTPPAIESNATGFSAALGGSNQRAAACPRLDANSPLATRRFDVGFMTPFSLSNATGTYLIIIAPSLKDLVVPLIEFII